MFSKEKIRMVPKLSLMPHTLRDVDEACKLGPEGNRY